MPNVSLKQVSKVYPGGVRAVDAVDLEIADGEFVVLVGPSGCGKSTTLRMIAGLEEITSGTIRIGDRVVNDVAARDRDIAMVFQSYALYPHLTVRQNLEFPLLRRRRHASRLRALLSPAYAKARRAEIAAHRERVDAAAKVLEIESLLSRKPKALSGGQRQRVALGRALVRDPAVFLLDEPLSNLDARLRLEMRAELRMLHRRTGGTMVHVTHDQEEAMTLGDRLVVMKDGVIRQTGTPIEIYERPADSFVAGFIGTPAMNLVEGLVQATGGNGEFVARRGRDEQAVAWRFPMSATRADAVLAGSTGRAPRPTTLGLRPDAVRVLATGENGETGAAGAGESAAGETLVLDATLEAVERYGDRMDLVLDANGVRLVSRSNVPVEVPGGSMVRVSLDLSKAHLFAGDGLGARID